MPIAYDFKPTIAYVARCRGCNAIIAVGADLPYDLRGTAQMLARWVKDNLIVGSVPFGEQRIEDCTCERQATLFESEQTI